MLSHCANSRCSRPFLRLRQGKLFLVETEFVAKSKGPMAPSSPRMRSNPGEWNGTGYVTSALRFGRWCTTASRGSP